MMQVYGVTVLPTHMSREAPRVTYIVVSFVQATALYTGYNFMETMYIMSYIPLEKVKDGPKFAVE